MGIDTASVRMLMEHKANFGFGGEALMLGRQKIRSNEKTDNLYSRWAEQLDLKMDAEKFKQDDGYSESFFKEFGCSSIETMDFSAYEGAKFIHDLNEPVSKEMHNKFDFIFDGGTLEHVFDVAQSFRNVFDMLKVGGTFLGLNPMNGWPTHGMYQFTPDLTYAFWRHKANCEVVRCAAVPVYIRKNKAIEIPDSAELNRRTNYARFMDLSERYYLLTVVQKTDSSSIEGNAFQGDYLRIENVTLEENSSDKSSDSGKK